MITINHSQEELALLNIEAYFKGMEDLILYYYSFWNREEF